MEEKIEELIDEIQQSSFASRQVRPFNQPDLIAISSLDRNVEDPNANGFSSFTVNLPLPALEVKSLQLLQTNIPQANANIPNTACTFWYYRLSQYSGLTPSLDNLYYVRLLPTTYKQEYIYQPSQYGYNQTFYNYNSVATQLVKSCAKDLLLNIVDALIPFEDEDFQTNAYVPFLPDDVSITYDTASNKFQMTGLNTEVAYIPYDANVVYDINTIITNTVKTKAYINIFKSLGVNPNPVNLPTFTTWVSGTNYPLFQVLTYNGIVYQLVIDGENTTQSPAQQTPAHYTRIGRALDVSQYASWVSGTNYNVGQVVSYNGSVYVLFNNGENVNNPPSAQPLHWVIQTTQIRTSTFWRRKYIDIVGTWGNNMFYPIGTIVEYEGDLYQSTSIEPSAFGQPPTNDDYWDIFTPPANWYSYLITGYSDPNVRKLQGELFNVAWNSEQTYNENAIVYHNELPYIALKTNRDDEPFVSIPVWTTGVIYNANSLVSHEGYIYSAILTNTSYNPAGATTVWARLTAVSSNPPLDAWSNTTTYAQFDLVEYNGVMYQSINAGANVGNNPLNNITWWVLRNYQTWNATITYQPHSVVFYNNYFYQTDAETTNSIPSFNSAVWTLQGGNLLEWSSLINYNIGDYSIYGSRYFKSLTNDNLNNPPVSFPEGWELIGVVGTWGLADAPLQTGLYGLTSRYDMTEFIGNNAVITNFPYGVGGQPFNPNPKRLLNSILGFTWAGSFNPSQLADIGTYSRAVLTTRQAPLLYNRLRPVPDYIVSITPPAELTEELGQDQSATISLTYTADGYANLNYSSILSIYADVVKASSVDTQGTTKLLALTSMNCGNLGIAFWSNYIENPLLKVQGDIYSIYIEFRDEFGEPFVLTNNAVATLTFKLNY